jgi:non-lysosomal glucosylceramidase
MVSLLWQAPIGIRLWRHIREENARKRVITFIIIAHCTLICLVLVGNHKEQTNHCIYSLQGGFYIDPFAKRNATSCLGIPVGGIG